MSDSFAAAWTVACQSSLSVGCPRQERILDWAAISFLQGSSPPGIRLGSLAWQVGFLPLSHQGNRTELAKPIQTSDLSYLILMYCSFCFPPVYFACIQLFYNVCFIFVIENHFLVFICWSYLNTDLTIIPVYLNHWLFDIYVQNLTFSKVYCQAFTK